MKIVAIPIKAVVIFEYANAEKPPMPYKFKVREDSGEEITVVIDRFISIEKSRICGEECLIYKCQSLINGVEKRYELKYIISKYTWQLYKI